ncbi:hypothetical protein SBOR_5684 [Sclerotinia borealis F-4128]|uniref:Uncharacterized protein n=1 Tax=Sclerotinia borealis (strain F-4128) TaxID=1432307 RepID=W9CHC0_SCLBF|nr:hypothetical protein SBOR_5684 [Sclerotinia borealis F-4128]
MDPVTVLGVAASALQVAQFIGSTIQGLHTLRGKFRDADTTIRLLISKLSTIRAAVFQIRDWAEFNSHDSPKERQFMDGLHVALDGCQAAIDVLSEEIKDLTVTTKDSSVEMPIILGMRGRVAALWSEDTMKAHEDRLHGQVQALQLLLMAGQCRDAGTQKSLLALKENRRLIQKVADDTKSLRETQSSTASQISRSARQSIFGSSLGGSVFEFERTLQQSHPYNNINSMSETRDIARTNNQLPNIIHQKPATDKTSSADEGYETGITQSEPRSPASSNHCLSMDTRPFLGQTKLLPEFNNFDIYRSRSVTSNSTKLEPMVKRWLSSSSSSGESLKQEDKLNGLRKKRFWPSRLGKINTLSATSLLTSPDRAKSAGPHFPTANRLKRGQDVNFNQSIDFGSLTGLQTPAIVRAAQAGSGVEIQALLSNGNDIEAFHDATQRTALAVASHCGNAGLVDLLLECNADLTTRDVNLDTPLHLAASRDHYSTLKMLLDEDVDIEVKNKDGWSPLWAAAYGGHVKSVDILAKRGAKINSRSNDQCTALHAAAKRGDKQMAELLVRNGADIEARDNQFMTALHYACEYGHQNMVDYLFQKGANLEVPGNVSRSPLLCASATGQLEVVEFLSKRKVNPKSMDEKGANALHCAARNGHVEVVKYLLDWKLPIYEGDIAGLTPLHLAVIGQHFGVVELLLRRKAALDRRCREGRTPLHYACGSDSPDIVSLLLSAGAYAEEETKGDNRRPIHIAAAKGSVRIVEVLNGKGIAIDQRDSGGNRALCIACHHGHVQIVEKLLSYNEPLRMRFRDRPNKDSPLCIAAKAGHLDVVKLLLNKGASVKERDEFGYIPLRYAAYYGHPEVLELLMEAGAELYDEGEDSHGWGFLLKPATIGFSDTTDISEDRKHHVRKLLDEMERRHHERDDIKDNKHQSSSVAELGRGQRNDIYRNNTLDLRQELVGSVLRTELPTERGVTDIQPQKSSDLSPSSFLSPRQDRRGIGRGEAKLEVSPLMTISTDATTPEVKGPIDVSQNPSTIFDSHLIVSRDIAALIAERQAEIQQLQQYLSSNQSTTETSLSSENSPQVYEMSAD